MPEFTISVGNIAHVLKTHRGDVIPNPDQRVIVEGIRARLHGYPNEDGKYKLDDVLRSIGGTVNAHGEPSGFNFTAEEEAALVAINTEAQQ